MKLKSFGEAWVCNLYSITTNQAAIIALFRVVNRYVGNLAPMPGVFPDYPAPVVRNAGETGSGVRFHGHPITVCLPRVARFHVRRLGSIATYTSFIVSGTKARACAILAEFNKAQTELVGKAVVLTDGKAGTVDEVWLDEFHGLRISIRGHEGKWPVSTIKLTQRDLESPGTLDARTVG
jgi:hypothetical protein